ncbi:MAG: enoyl-CoA hydratase/isomerase family protein [Terriglobales bacterium]
MPAYLQLATDGPVSRLILSRPPLNIIDVPMAREILAALEALPAATRIVQFESAPECRCFSAGVAVDEHLPERAEAMLRNFHAIFRRLAVSDFLTLAVVRDLALGGGAELACFCDAVLAADHADFGFPEIRVGSFPPVASVLLPAMVGLRRAQDWILSGRRISAAEALASGLIDRAVPSGQLDTAAAAHRAQWLALSPQILPVARRAVRGDGFLQALADIEDRYRRELPKLEDAREGVRAFLEKRPPVWAPPATGRPA